MSAFVCGIDHFKALALFAASRSSFGKAVDPRYIEGLKHVDPSDRNLASLYANILYRENIRSVLARYPNDTWDTMPGPCEKPESIAITARDEINPKLRLAPVAILKMCDCLEYQSCETEDWDKTVAYRLVNKIRDAAIRKLPGYDDAPWDYYATEAA